MQLARLSQSIVVEWLPLSFFDSHAHFALSVGESYTADVHIVGGSVRVTSSSVTNDHDDGEEHTFQSVSFASDVAFEQYLNFIIRRAVLNV